MYGVLYHTLKTCNQGPTTNGIAMADMRDNITAKLTKKCVPQHINSL